MKIKYKLDLEDVIAFNLYHHKNSPSFKKMRLLFSFSISILTLIIVVNIASAYNSNALYILGVILAIAEFFICKKRFGKATMRQVERMYQEGENKRILTEHVLELCEDSLKESNMYSNQETKYIAIEKIKQSDDHAFIYIASVMAHIIPKAKIIEGNYSEFLEALRARLKLAGNSNL